MDRSLGAPGAARHRTPGLAARHRPPGLAAISAIFITLSLSACAGGSGGESLVEDLTPNADGFITTRSGLKYKVVRQGVGPKPTSQSLVLVHYSTRLRDGTLIDSSYERGEPEVIAMEELIRGFQEALQLMPVGSHYQVTVPGRLGYGWRGSGDGLVGPNETLIFEIELYQVQER